MNPNSACGSSRYTASVPARRQEETSFEAAFLEHYPRVYGVLFRLVGDRAEAGDLTLETFWKLWQQPPPRADNLGGWLYQTSKSLGRPEYVWWALIGIGVLAAVLMFFYNWLLVPKEQIEVSNTH